MKKFTILILAIFIVSGLFYSCSKSPKCWGNNKNEGIIQGSVRIGCEPLQGEQNYIIQDDSAYLQTFTNTITGQLACTPPTIDFSNNSLLGLFATGGCEVKYIREVTSIDNESKYHYKVTVKSCGTCKSEVYSYNWVTVPKIPEGWTVTFEVENK